MGSILMLHSTTNKNRSMTPSHMVFKNLLIHKDKNKNNISNHNMTKNYPYLPDMFHPTIRNMHGTSPTKNSFTPNITKKQHLNKITPSSFLPK